MIAKENLKLNEALISVNSSVTRSSQEVYYQNGECYGCKWEKLADINDRVTSFKLDTSYSANLRLQETAGSNSSCEFKDLALNSNAEYRIDVSYNPISNQSTGRIDCQFITVVKGDCLLCPFALLVCILFALSALEWVYETFVVRNHGKASPSSSSSSEAVDQEEPEPVDRDASAETGTKIDDEHLKNPQSSDCEMTQKRITKVSFSSNDSGQKLNPSSSQRRRIYCLDAFRGLTITGMIFVNYGGAGYSIWEHRPWNGITLADFVFPFFIFSMGASIAISINSAMKRVDNHRSSILGSVLLRICRRSFILMLLGLFLNSKWIDHDRWSSWSELRLTGVLQRFSISYLVVASVYAMGFEADHWIKTKSGSNRVPHLSGIAALSLELLIAVSNLSIYIYLTFFFNYNSSCPTGYTGPGGRTEDGKYENCTGGAASWLDRTVLGENHLYHDLTVKKIFHTNVYHDPEGILGYTTSILLTLIGLQCGKILGNRQANVSHRSRLVPLAQWGAILAASCPLIAVIPINKKLWSLSFVIVTALAAILVLALLYVLLEMYSCLKCLLMRLMISAGRNAIFLYVGHSLITGLLPWWVPIENPASHLQLLLRLSWAVFVWLLIAAYMDRKRLYIKI